MADCLESQYTNTAIYRAAKHLCRLTPPVLVGLKFIFVFVQNVEGRGLWRCRLRHTYYILVEVMLWVMDERSWAV